MSKPQKKLVAASLSLALAFGATPAAAFADNVDPDSDGTESQAAEYSEYVTVPVIIDDSGNGSAKAIVMQVGSVGGDLLAALEGSFMGDVERVCSAKGKTFEGWAYSDGCLVKDDLNREVTSETAVYAKYAEHAPIHVVIDGNAGSVKTINLEIGSSLRGGLEDLIDDVYDVCIAQDLVFVGWTYSDGSLIWETDDDPKVTGETTVYAKYAADRFAATLHYEVNDGLPSGGGITIYPGDKLADVLARPIWQEEKDLAEEHAPAGKHFIGWGIYIDGELKAIPEDYIVSGDVDVYAMYGVIVRFIDSDGTVNSLMVSENGTVAPPADPPCKEGYKFEGWSLSADEFIPVDFSKVAKDEDGDGYVAFYAYYSKIPENGDNGSSGGQNGDNGNNGASGDPSGADDNGGNGASDDQNGATKDDGKSPDNTGDMPSDDNSDPDAATDADSQADGETDGADEDGADESSETPQTGDETNAAAVAGIGGVAGLMAAVATRLRRRGN